MPRTISTSVIQLNDVGEIKIIRKHPLKNMRIAISQTKGVVVSVPMQVSDSSVLDFITSNHAWITKTITKIFSVKQQSSNLQQGSNIGKNFRIYFVPTDQNFGKRIKDFEITISHPKHLDISSAEVQNYAKKIATEALKKEAKIFLPVLLNQLSKEHHIDYHSLSVKKMTTRWGSCSPKKQINLNVYLMQLPIRFIEYVIIHELVHTIHFNHSAQFWQKVASICPDYKLIRQAMKKYPTDIIVTG